MMRPFCLPSSLSLWLLLGPTVSCGHHESTGPGAPALAPPDDEPPPSPKSPCDFPAKRAVEVTSSEELKTALATAEPGDVITMANGVYEGRFEVTIAGTKTAPLVLCGTKDAVLDGGAMDTGYTLYLEANNVILSGFRVVHGLKGIMADGASDCQLLDLEVSDIGNEGIHLRKFSSRNTIARVRVHDTGKVGSPHYGEGVYIGSANNNWCRYTDCKPDRCDQNRVLYSTIGPDTTAESIDIKEGSQAGIIRGNTFLGAGMVSPDGADSWIDVKGNGYHITENHGKDAPIDGFQTHVPLEGYGSDNVFRKNIAEVNGEGYGYRIKKEGASGNVVGCDNQVSGAAMGLANVPCSM